MAQRPAKKGEKKVQQDYGYQWQGRDKSGKLVKGSLRAPSDAAVRAVLLRQGIAPRSIKRAKDGARKGKITTRDIMGFTRQMATMVNSGMPIPTGLAMIANGSKNLNFRQMMQGIQADVESGTRFADALAEHPKYFDELYVNMVASGEESGTMDTTLRRLAEVMEKNDAIRKQVKKALTYPIIVLIVAFGVIIMMMVKVVPAFEEMFQNSGKPLPGITQILVDSSRWVRANGVIAVMIVAGVVFAFKAMLKSSVSFRYKYDAFLLKLPIFGQLISLGSSARFARTLATMTDAGTPLLDATESLVRSTPNLVYREAITHISDALKVGQQLNFAMKQTGQFSELVTHMVEAGEESGTLGEMLSKVADIYEDDVNTTVGSLTAAIEPIMIVFLGVVVGGLLAALYLPIFSMGETV